MSFTIHLDINPRSPSGFVISQGGNEDLTIQVPWEDCKIDLSYYGLCVEVGLGVYEMSSLRLPRLLNDVLPHAASALGHALTLTHVSWKRETEIMLYAIAGPRQDFWEPENLDLVPRPRDSYTPDELLLSLGYQPLVVVLRRAFRNCAAVPVDFLYYHVE